MQWLSLTRTVVSTSAILTAIVAGWASSGQAAPSSPGAGPPAITQGSLITVDSDGRPREFCPLRHTGVTADVSGFVARVTVVQEFENRSAEAIEAVYTFPLPQRAAVDRMVMHVGDRTVEAKIKRREDAQVIYEAARSGGRMAALLEQERPNIFTQSIANILPGEHVRITLSYVELLAYEGGTYEFVFPMVVGPRYIPGAPTGKQGGGWAPDTTVVPDGSRITPPVTPPGTRAGHDISISLNLDAGVGLERVASPSHDIDVQRPGATQAGVALRTKAVIPNKDFIVRYAVAGGRIKDAVLTHRGERGGFATLILQPPDRVTPSEITPKELVFVLDTSGSMSGFPIEKAKETMKLALAGLYPQDTFDLITFSGDTHILFPAPVPATPQNLARAQAFLESRSGGGGTDMMKAIRAALEPSDAQDHVRIVCFMTDGYVGNDMEIIAEVQKHPNARVFSFGIGSSVNRFLLDKMAEHGRGEVEYVGLHDDGSTAARRFHERVRSPLLTDLAVEWNGLPIADVYPKRIPDLFAAKPIVVYARYTGAARGTIRLRGHAANGVVTRDIPVVLPEQEPRHDVLATLWARNRVEELMAQDYAGAQNGRRQASVRDAVTQLGLDYRLLTHYTAFVAVEDVVVNENGTPRRMEVPVEMPEGVSYDGVFGSGEALFAPANMAAQISSVPKSLGMARRESGLGAAPKDRATLFVDARSTPKLHATLNAIASRLAEHKSPLPEEAGVVTAGRIDVQVWLTDTAPGTIDALKNVGLEIIAQPKSGKLVIGRLPIGKLTALAALKPVRYVNPAHPVLSAVH
jgi:Ca-activated chloride channel family protein